MKILYLFQHFVPPDKPGITRVYEYATRLMKNGHEVHIITSPENLPEYQNLKTPTEVTIANIPCTIIPVAYSHHMGYTERLISYFGFAFYSTLVAIKRDADVIVAVSTPLTIAIPGIITHLWKRKPMVFELGDLWPATPFEMGIIKNPILKFGASVLEWLAYHNSAHIVALSEGIAEGVLARGYDASKVSVITNASDTHLFDVPPATGKPIRDRLLLKDHEKLVVYTGTFGEANGAEYLVDIAKEMYSIDDRIKFLMVGDGKRKGIALERAKSYGILGKTIFIEGPISKKDVPAILSAATITTVFYGKYNVIWRTITANKLFDSFAAGKPIAINENRVGWLIPLFAETGVGVGLSPVDAHLAAHELYDFLNDEEKLKRATESARNLAYHRFNRDVLAQRFEEVLISVVHENKTRI